MANGRTFNAQVRDWAAKFPDKMDALARQTAQEVSQRVVTATPVDTGFLRGSWQPSIGRPGPATPGDASAKVALTISGMRAGDMFYMTNGAKYAKFVEFGTSKMAPRYYVTDNVKRWPVIVRKVAKDIGLK